MGVRINVLGTSGSGKTTVSKRIAQKLNVSHIQMDELFWKPNWRESIDEEFFPKLEKALSSDDWVLDGNYTRTIPIKWRQVQIVVYLDLPFHIVLYRVIKRSLIRAFKSEELWAGNRETIWKQFFTRDSIILWTLKMFYENRERFEVNSKSAQYSQIRFVRLCSDREVDDFVIHGLPTVVEENGFPVE